MTPTNDPIKMLAMMGNIRDALVTVSNHLKGDVVGDGVPINPDLIMDSIRLIESELDVSHDGLVKMAMAAKQVRWLDAPETPTDQFTELRRANDSLSDTQEVLRKASIEVSTQLGVPAQDEAITLIAQARKNIDFSKRVVVEAMSAVHILS
jgi:hypothetical protein